MVVTDTSPISIEEDAARRALMVHRSNADGLCQGCLDNRAVFTWFPCEQARLALKVANPGTEGELP
jgi:hypothetical protein